VATVSQTLHAPVKVTVPVSVTERASVGRAAVSASLSENVVESATATRTVEVRRGAVAARRACARASTSDAAHSIALNRAYRQALAAGKPQAKAAAEKALATYAVQQLQALRSETRTRLQAQAQTAAAAVRQTLARQALAQATARARALSP
jgi:hypothetical protein